MLRAVACTGGDRRCRRLRRHSAPLELSPPVQAREPDASLLASKRNRTIRRFARTILEFTILAILGDVIVTGLKALISLIVW